MDVERGRLLLQLGYRTDMLGKVVARGWLLLWITLQLLMFFNFTALYNYGV